MLDVWSIAHMLYGRARCCIELGFLKAVVNGCLAATARTGSSVPATEYMEERFVRLDCMMKLWSLRLAPRWCSRHVACMVAYCVFI